MFWCDPVEDLSVVFFTQVMGMQPRNMLRAKIGSMVYSSIGDRQLSAHEVAVASARARVAGSGARTIRSHTLSQTIALAGHRHCCVDDVLVCKLGVSTVVCNTEG